MPSGIPKSNCKLINEALKIQLAITPRLLSNQRLDNDTHDFCAGECRATELGAEVGSIAREAWENGFTSKAEWSKTGKALNLRAAALDLVKTEGQIDHWHSLSEEMDDLREFLGEEKRWE